jgi:glycosyltransferase involved in cell wall biosynthesis
LRKRRSSKPRGGAGPLVALAANDGWNIVNYRAPLIRALRQAGIQVAVLAPQGPHTPAIRQMGVDFYEIPMSARGTSPLGDLRTAAAYLRTLRSIRPAAFLGFTAKPNIYGSLAAHALGIPVINNISGLGAVFGGKSPLRSLVSNLYRLALRRSSTVFFQNPDDEAQFAAAGLVRPAQAAALPGSGIDLDHFAPRTRKSGAAPFTFLFAARLLWAKGVREFVDAARLIHAGQADVRFRILGIVELESPAAVPLQQLLDWQGEGVIDYLGATSDVRDAFSQADCVVLPSYYREGVPRVLLEASAMAIPIITTDAPGCREAVDEGITGLLCEPRSARSLAAAMARIIGLSPAERRMMGKSARNKMERQFRAEIVHRAYLDALAKVGVAAR